MCWRITSLEVDIHLPVDVPDLAVALNWGNGSQLN
jgi:hypothetical protein